MEHYTALGMIYLGRAGLAAREPGRAWQMLMLRSVLRPSLRELGLGLDSGDPQLSLDKLVVKMANIICHLLVL